MFGDNFDKRCAELDNELLASAARLELA